jgi:hypothetical protein
MIDNAAGPSTEILLVEDNPAGAAESGAKA